MKRLLIISPHFPPINAPDMQRVRMSLPYYSMFGWEAEVLTVQPEFIEGFLDENLVKTIPTRIKVHRAKALSVKFTRKIGLGSLSIRCYFSFKRAGDRLLKQKKFDLVFFSTTMFHVCALGRRWKQKFGVPFIIDFQDPWRNDFYLNKPKQERPPKFKMAYLINKWMEAYTMPFADGVMSVSEGYIGTLHSRYPILRKRPYSVIPFGCSIKDFEIAGQMNSALNIFQNGKINIVYIGAITPFFIPLIRAFFIAFKQKIDQWDKYFFWFIGTTYSTRSSKTMVASLADELGIRNLVHEEPERITYFEALQMMQVADILFVPGSRDKDYNASKIYNCLLAQRPIFSIFNWKSEVVNVVEQCDAGIVVKIKGEETEEALVELITAEMQQFSSLHLKTPELKYSAINEFSAEARTNQQVNFFDEVIDYL